MTIAETILALTPHPTPDDARDATLIAVCLAAAAERRRLATRLALGCVDVGEDGRAYVLVADTWIDVEIAQVLV